MFGLSTTLVSLPKDHKAMLANFKDCNSNDIPIMVTINKRLGIGCSIAINTPPKTGQIIFAIVLIQFCSRILSVN